MLGRALHHKPANGAEHAAQLSELYLQTLDRYAVTFGHLAPAEFWPDPRHAGAYAEGPATQVQTPARKQRRTWLVGLIICAGFAALFSGFPGAAWLPTLLVIICIGVAFHQRRRLFRDGATSTETAGSWALLGISFSSGGDGCSGGGDGGGDGGGGCGGGCG